MERPRPEPPDLREHGRGTTSDRRLFMQLLVFDHCPDPAILGEAVQRAAMPGVVYAEASDPLGAALLTASEEPADFVDKLRPVLALPTFNALRPRPGWAMLGRTYCLGYETDLEDVLLRRPIRHAFHDDWHWAVWYPLRRSGAFAKLPADQQRTILAEHGTIGMSFAARGDVSDVRLACHGLDAQDNDFVIGLIGERLAPLSKLVETMRKTEQTSTYLDRLGPFFVGRKIWQSPPPTW